MCLSTAARASGARRSKTPRQRLMVGPPIPSPDGDHPHLLTRYAHLQDVLSLADGRPEAGEALRFGLPGPCEDPLVG